MSGYRSEKFGSIKNVMYPDHWQGIQEDMSYGLGAGIAKNTTKRGKRQKIKVNCQVKDKMYVNGGENPSKTVVESNVISFQTRTITIFIREGGRYGF